MCVRLPFIPWSIVGVSLSQALPDYLITSHHLCAFLLYLARYLCGGKTKKKKSVYRLPFIPWFIEGVSSSQALPYYCTSICVRFGCTWRAGCVDSKPKKKENQRVSCLRVYFEKTIIKQNIKIILIAGVPSSQTLPGFLSTAPPSMCVPDVIGALACGFQTKKNTNNLSRILLRYRPTTSGMSPFAPALMLGLSFKQDTCIVSPPSLLRELK